MIGPSHTTINHPCLYPFLSHFFVFTYPSLSVTSVRNKQKIGSAAIKIWHISLHHHAYGKRHTFTSQPKV